MTQFIHLRVHSSYSLAEGALTPDKMVELCLRYKMPAVAITDTGNLFGSLEFAKEAAGKGVQPIIGCIFKIVIAQNFGSSQAGSKDKNPINNIEPDSILLLAKDQAGYQNLLQLLNISYFNPAKAGTPSISLQNLAELNSGLIMLTGGADGVLGKMLLNGEIAKAELLLKRFLEIFGDRLYLEIYRHNLPQEKKTEAYFIDFAYKYNIPLVATNDVYFESPSMFEAHDALLCVADARYTVETDRRRVSKQHYFRSSFEMAELFKDLPEAIENTVVIAKRCAVMPEVRAPMLPEYSTETANDNVQGADKAASADSKDLLTEIASKGLLGRLEEEVYKDSMTEAEKADLKKTYFERLEFELSVIIKMQFSGYFLIVSDFIKWSKRQNIPVGPGRGSGAGSVVAWALEITDLDPIRFGLLFERFLNPERVSMPDFDIDFCQERREEVIYYVQQKYGKERVAQIITFGKLQAKAVLRDVGRVLQMPYAEVNRISKMIPFNPIDPVTLSKAINMDKTLQDARDSDPGIAKLLDIGLKLEGLNRHASTHAAGVVIADRPIWELIPVYKDQRSDMPVTGYSMKYAEMSGLVKFDFLGLKTLTVIAKAIEFIKERGIEIDINKIPLDDKPTYLMLSKGDSSGVFQLESAGMKDTLRKLKPDNIEDIIALISLYRPGPMDNIPDYIARKHGIAEPDYLDPMLETILKETYGVIIYQEQVMQIAQVMGGYSLGGADLLRRAMGKKIAAEMDAQRKIFVDGAIKNGVSKDKASFIFDLVAKFAGYGFNKSHAAAYAMISYRTAYLKANYPVEFIAASMNLEIHDTDKVNMFCQEALAHNIKILLPDINESNAYFTPATVPAKEQELLPLSSAPENSAKFVESTAVSVADEAQDLTNQPPNAIKYALGALKNVGTDMISHIVSERQKNGKFTDIYDFVARGAFTGINKRALEMLIKAGCFDKLHDNRKSLVESMEAILRYGNLAYQEKNSNQTSLFGDDFGFSMPKPKLANVIDYKGAERLNAEFEATSMYLGKHPLDDYREILSQMYVITSNQFSKKLASGTSKIKVAGVLVSKRMRSSPRGRFATVIMSDSGGIFEISIFNEDLLETARDYLEEGQVLLIAGEARKDDGGVRIVAETIMSVDDALKNRAIQLKVFLNDNMSAIELKKLLANTGKGKGRITVVMAANGHKMEIILPETYNLAGGTIDEIRNIEGVEKVVTA